MRPSAALTGLDANFIADDVIAGALHKVFQLLPIDGRQRFGSGAGWLDKRRRGGNGYQYQSGFCFQLALGPVSKQAPYYPDPRPLLIHDPALWAQSAKAGWELPGLDFPILALGHGF